MNNNLSISKMAGCAAVPKCERSVNNNRVESVNDIGGSARATSCHQLSFIKLFQIICVLFLIAHVFIQPTSAIRLQVHKAKTEKRGGNFGWEESRALDYPQLADHGVRHNSVFGDIAPYSAWNLDSSRAAVPEYEPVAVQGTQGQADMDPSLALYLTENLVAKYVARQEKLQQQRKQAAFMGEVFGLH